MHNLFLKFLAIFVLSTGLATAAPLSKTLSDDKVETKPVRIEDIIPNYEQTDMFRIREKYEKVWQGVPNNERKGWKQFKRWEHFWKERLFPNGDFRQAIDIYAGSYKDLDLKNAERLQGNTWKLLGPINQPKTYNKYIDGKGLGRVNIVRFHPTNDNIIWIGAASGGVWYTNDAGETWNNFPFTQFLSLGVSDIAFSETDPNTVYVATGDADGSLGSASVFYTIGVIKTTDGGKNWEVTGMAHQLDNKVVINRLKVHQKDPNKVIAGTSDGIYKTTDGGKTWTKQITGNFRDFEVKPNNPNYVYAATYAPYTFANYIYVSEDFGDNWNLAHTIRGAGRIQMAVTPAAAENLYVLSSAIIHSGFHSFQVSKDAGKTFTVMSDSNTAKNPLNWAGRNLGPNQRGQSNYDLCLAVSPTDPDRIILGGIECHSSTDMGTNWKRVSNVTNKPKSEMHVDMHDLEYNPNTEFLYCGNDGGIYVSEDDGDTWKDITAGVSITQYYRTAMAPNNPNLMLAGAQDNGSSMYKDGEWYQIYGGDGMTCAFDPFNENNFWVSVYNGNVVGTTDGGKTLKPIVSKAKTDKIDGAWITPFQFDPNTQHTAYIGFANIWKTENGGSTWRKLSNFSTNSGVFTGLEISKKNSNYIYAWKYGALFQTTDGGATWKKISSANRTITSVCIHPEDPEKFWMTQSGYDKHDKVYFFNGKEFVNISGNLPNVPANFVTYLPDYNDRLYLGTDIGMYYTEAGSNMWVNINDNLPNVIISDIHIFRGEGNPKIRIGTYGRGLWEGEVTKCTDHKIKIKAQQDKITKCPHEEVTLSIEGDYSDIQWSNGETTKSITVKDAGLYSVMAMKGGCRVFGNTVTVDNKSTPSISISIVGNKTACVGDTIRLRATAGFDTYKWSTGETDRQIFVTNSGKYSVVATKKGFDCEAYSEELTFDFKEKPASMDFEIHGSRLVANKMDSYQWYKNDRIINGATQKIYQLTEADAEEAQYKVFGMNEHGCGVFSPERAAKYTSVKEPFNNLYTISPNPSNGNYIFKLNTNSGDNVSYIITDAAGRVVSEYSAMANSTEFTHNIDLTAQANGAYLMKVTLNGKEKIIKLIKK